VRPTFARIQFKLPGDRRLNSDARTLSLDRPSLPTAFELIAQGDKPFTKTDTLVIRSSAVPSVEAATELGERASVAVLIAATQIRMGVDLGKDAPKSGCFAAGLELVRQQAGLLPETAIVNDTLGLTLVDASRQTVFAGIGPVSGIVGTPIERFVDAFDEGFVLALSVDQRSLLALELFSASKFEASLRARFLTLVTAIECIAERPRRPPEAVQFLQSLVDRLTGVDLTDGDKAQLRSALRDLESRSISWSTRALVERHCGTEKAKLFGKCYIARSELVHGGQTAFDLGANTHLLEEVVADTIVESLRHAARR
jgi:hypothetical protein